MKFDGKKIITNETELVEVFSNHYINIVKKLSVKNQDMLHVTIKLKTKALLYK